MTAIQKWRDFKRDFNILSRNLRDSKRAIRNHEIGIAFDRRIIRLHKQSIFFIKDKIRTLRHGKGFFFGHISSLNQEIFEHEENIRDEKVFLLDAAEDYVATKKQVLGQKEQILQQMKDLVDENPFLESSVDLSILSSPSEPFLFNKFMDLNLIELFNQVL